MGYCERLLFHPHVHCIVTGGGLSHDQSQWVEAPRDFLFPVHVIGSLRGSDQITSLLPHAGGDYLIPQAANGWFRSERSPCAVTDGTRGSRIMAWRTTGTLAMVGPLAAVTDGNPALRTTTWRATGNPGTARCLACLWTGRSSPARATKTPPVGAKPRRAPVTVGRSNAPWVVAVPAPATTHTSLA
jgi:hypothetical protein